MPKDNQPQKEQLKVTDKRIFTPEGDIREEFRDSIRPSAAAAAPAPSEPPPAEPTRPAPPQQNKSGVGERRRSIAEKAETPGTPFTSFLEPLIAQAYMSLGMLSNPYQPQQPKVDAAAARQMIDILTLLHEKTAGNLTPDEDDFLTAHLGELKLAFVKRTKTI